MHRHGDAKGQSDKDTDKKTTVKYSADDGEEVGPNLEGQMGYGADGPLTEDEAIAQQIPIKPVAEWSVDEVQAWMSEKSRKAIFDQHKGLFFTQKVKGSDLLDFTHDILKADPFNIEAWGDRNSIIKEVSLLKGAVSLGPPSSLSTQVNFSDENYLIISSTNALAPPFPGFFVGFPHIKPSLNAFVESIRVRRVDSRPAAAAIVGINKVGKTRVLMTVLPAYVQYCIPDKKVVFVPVPCDHMVGEVSTVQAAIFSRITASLANSGVHWQVKVGEFSKADDVEFKMERLVYALNALDYMVVFLLDEYQQLFQYESYPAAIAMATFMKRLLYHPDTPNLGFVVCSSNSPSLWSCMSLTSPNGRDILGEMIIIPVGCNITGNDLAFTSQKLLELLPSNTDGMIFEVCWNPSPGMYAFIAEKYKEANMGDAVDRCSVFVRTIELVQSEIMARVSMDYSLFLRLSNDQDPRAHLWDVLYDLIFDGLDAQQQLAMRRIDRLPILKTQSGKLYLPDDYLRWFISAHNNAGHFDPIPTTAVSPFFQAVFDKHQSSFQLLSAHKSKIQDVFERQTLAAFEVGEQDYDQYFRESCRWCLSQDLLSQDWEALEPVHRLAGWMTFMVTTPFGTVLNIEGRITSFQSWANGQAVKNYNECPMWELATLFRNFCGHAIEEPSKELCQRSLVVNFVTKLWGERVSKRILLNVALLNVTLFNEF